MTQAMGDAMLKKWLCAGFVLACVGATPARADPVSASGLVSFDFNFTGFSGAFAWSEGNDISASDPSTYLNVGTVNGVQPVYDGTHVNRTADGSQWIIGGTAPLSGTTARLVANSFPGLPNVVTFTPASDQVVSTNVPFVIGTLSFTNGAWFGGVDNLPFILSFTVTTQSSTTALNQVWNDSFVVDTNVGSGSCSDPAVQATNADFVHVSSAPLMGSLRVFEPFCAPTPDLTQEGSADIKAVFDGLEPLQFVNVQGEGFLSSSVTPGPLPSGVPEPATWALLTAGFLALALVSCRKLVGCPPRIEDGRR
jgi:hypothetical protein